MTVLIDSDLLIEVSRGRNHDAGLYLGQYQRSHGVETADALIAASAVANRAELWTRNRKHYPMKEVSFFDGSLRH